MADQIEWSCDDIAPEGKLPGDVMVSILTYLPVKSLMKFKAVSKPWCCFISSPRFSKLHLLRQSLLPANNCFMLLWDGSAKNRWKHVLLDLSRNYTTPADNNVLILEFPPVLKPGLTNIIIIASCNGLVCLGDFMMWILDSDDLFLWNPATRRYRSIDLPKEVILNSSTLGLCYVDAIDDFKILVWNNRDPPYPTNTLYLYVYSLSSHSWDKFDFDYPKTCIRFESPTFMGRCMHWLSFTCPNGFDCTCASASEILAFDVIDGALSSYRLPVNCCLLHIQVSKTLITGGCLSIVILRDTVDNDVDARERGFEVWVMEEYGVEGSWVKRFFIQGLTQIRSPLVSWLKGEIVVSCSDSRKNLIFYDPYSKKKRYVKFSAYEVSGLFDYVESLASVGTS